MSDKPRQITQPTHDRTSQIPFPALVGLETAQKALILLAIEPRLRGVLLAAHAGTGKSSMVRGFRSLLDPDIPFHEIPTSIDIENLLGGLDLAATLRTRALVIRKGVLARTHGGLAYIDGINLLAEANTNLLLSVLDDHEVRLEREGMSIRWPADVRLIGSYDPSEGMPRRHLIDRLGMIVQASQQSNEKDRKQVIENNFLIDPNNWQEDSDFLRGLIQTAREHLPNVVIDDEQIEQIIVTSMAYGVEGHRADLFAIYAAQAAAAYELREYVDESDLELAVQLVILPRATQIPAEATPPPPAPPEQSETDGAPKDDQKPDDKRVDESELDEIEASSLPETLTPPPEQILEAIESELPDALDELPFLSLRKGKAGSRGTTTGNRGRHIRSIPGDPKRARIDISATLRTAAPWQPIRATDKSLWRRRNQINIHMDDIRVKQYRSKAGALFCFAVDASGSMALHRMRQAKGAVNILLQKAYVHRDRIALIAFRGEQAELLMPPTQSVELAKRALDLLPTGGGTPLASALQEAYEVAKQARQRGILQTVVIMLTDGRANVSLREEGDAQEELNTLANSLRDTGIKIVIVDTKRSYLSRGEARKLAEILQAEYIYLPNANSTDIAEVALQARGMD